MASHPFLGDHQMSGSGCLFPGCSFPPDRTPRAAAVLSLCMCVCVGWWRGQISSTCLEVPCNWILRVRPLPRGQVALKGHLVGVIRSSLSDLPVGPLLGT